MKRKKSAISQEVLDQIIQRVVAVAQPDKIILFGSAAQGEMRPHSDVDLFLRLQNRLIVIGRRTVW